MTLLWSLGKQTQVLGRQIINKRFEEVKAERSVIHNLAFSFIYFALLLPHPCFNIGSRRPHLFHCVYLKSSETN